MGAVPGEPARARRMVANILARLEAMIIRYEGNALHKRYPWFGKAPALRSDKTECPPRVPAEQAFEVLTAAIQASLVAGRHSNILDGDHPKYVWGRSFFEASNGERCSIAWEASSSNRESPVYHAYPIQRDRHSDTMPLMVEEWLWPDA